MSESEKIDKPLALTTKLKKALEHEGDGDNSNCWHTNCWHTKNNPKGLGKETGGVGNQMKNQDHTEHNIVEIGWNTQKSPGDF